MQRLFDTLAEPDHAEEHHRYPEKRQRIRAAGSRLMRPSRFGRFAGAWPLRWASLFISAPEERRAIEEARKLEEFLLAVLDTADLKETSILITSGHGNLEDLSSSGHTSNPVPALLWGRPTTDSPKIVTILDMRDSESIGDRESVRQLPLPEKVKKLTFENDPRVTISNHRDIYHSKKSMPKSGF